MVDTCVGIISDGDGGILGRKNALNGHVQRT
jgi:hypothetical protein